jgi:hypothetical protein
MYVFLSLSTDTQSDVTWIIPREQERNNALNSEHRESIVIKLGLFQNSAMLSNINIMVV